MKRLIRPMSVEDIEACLELWRHIEGIVLRAESDNPAALKSFLERNPGLSFVADEEARLIGNILCGHDGRRGHVYHLAVLPDHRQTHCATALLDASLHSLAAQHITRCHAYFRARNLTARTFWKRRNADLQDDIRVATIVLPQPDDQDLVS